MFRILKTHFQVVSFNPYIHMWGEVKWHTNLHLVTRYANALANNELEKENLIVFVSTESWSILTHRNKGAVVSNFLTWNQIQVKTQRRDKWSNSFWHPFSTWTQSHPPEMSGWWQRIGREKKTSKTSRKQETSLEEKRRRKTPSCVSPLIGWTLVSSFPAPPPVGGVIVGITKPCPCISSMSPPVCPPCCIMASPPPSPSSVASPRPSVVQRCRFEFCLLLPVVLCVAADRQWLCHGRQVTHLAELRCTQWRICVGGIKLFLVASVTTRGVHVTRDGRLRDDVIR